MGAIQTSFRDVQAGRLRQAMLAVLQNQTATMPSVALDENQLLGRLPAQARFVSGAEQTAQAEPDREGEAALYFQSLLELGYLVASADGLDEREREMLALLVEQITESRVAREKLLLHFADLDQTSDWLGRSERLMRVAALADGELAEPEIRVLLELGKHFSFSERAVTEAVERVTASIRRELEG
jgi:hypothetical protein